jgi:UDP-2,4-diacetamido-2,4,6-trideoxy-beta-L-altropyranose hydrolase
MSPAILFACDAGPVTGGGHLMRSLTLAEALAAAGARCSFVETPAVKALLDIYAPLMDRTPAGSGREEDLIAAVRTAAAYDAVVFDHYGLDAQAHQAGAAGRPVLVIDDLANRPLQADLVLDSGPDRRAEDYQGRVPPGTELLLGPGHAPVRPAFAALRPATLARRLDPDPPRRVLVSLGLGDLGAITGQVVEAILPLCEDLALDVALGAAAPSRSKVAALALVYSHVTLHIDSQDMAGLASRADLAIGAGGSSSWERCVLGLPSLLLILADNQRAAARSLETAGAVLALEAMGQDPALAGALREDFCTLVQESRLRMGMSLAAAGICDGQGAARTADAFLARIARTRPI